MIKNHDDPKTQELIKSISAIFRKIENLIENLNDNEKHVYSINESFRLLNNYEKMVPLKYQKFFLKHFDDLINDFTNKVVSYTSNKIANLYSQGIETIEMMQSIRFVIRSIECLLANYSGVGNKTLIIIALFDFLDEYKSLVPQKHQKIFFRHFNHLTNEFATKRNLENIITIKMASPMPPDNASSQNNKVNEKNKSWRGSWTSYGDYKNFTKTTMEKTTDPFLVKRLRRI